MPRAQSIVTLSYQQPGLMAVAKLRKSEGANQKVARLIRVLQMLICNNTTSTELSDMASVFVFNIKLMSSQALALTLKAVIFRELQKTFASLFKSSRKIAWQLENGHTTTPEE